MAFDETLALHRSVCGYEGGVAALVDALVGEATAGPHPPDPHVVRLQPPCDRGALEATVFENTGQWRSLDNHIRRQGLPAVRILVEAESLIRSAGRGGPEDHHRDHKRQKRLQWATE